jgi:tetratricopeptide (TPR) repeat protein
METLSKTEKSIQVLFDSNESGRLKDEIFSRLMIPLPLSYFREALEHYSGAVVVFTPSGLSKALPDLFAEEDLVEMDRAVAFASGPMLSTPRTIADPQENRFSEYAAYTRVIAIIKALLEPTSYKQDLFAKTTITSFAQKGIDRIGEIETLMGQIATLRDCDRVDISNLLVENNHVSAAADLFVRLTTEKQVPSDLIDCHDAFNIGRKLFLLGLHEKAYRYLKLAFLRHPFDADYEMWYHLTREKLNKPPIPFYSPAEHQPDLQLFYATLADIREGHHKAAIKRLENRLKKDSHDSLATHLLSKYFNRPLDERHFFPAQEGL